MSWSIGFDNRWNRDIGYGVPAYCDFPGCKSEIDRGLAFVCGGEPFGGEKGCGLYFCSKHLLLNGSRFLCERCSNGKKSFKPRKEHPDWINHKATDESWQQWRKENPAELKKLLKNAN